jgi:hypothetical protein
LTNRLVRCGPTNANEEKFAAAIRLLEKLAHKRRKSTLLIPGSIDLELRAYHLAIAFLHGAEEKPVTRSEERRGQLDQHQRKPYMHPKTEGAPLAFKPA